MSDDQAVKTRHRASALPPEERRTAIIASTLPLLVIHGTDVTTHQIAEAAGIAEGTIFRVFPDKESLIAATIERAFDPASTESQLRAIDRELPLETRLRLAVEIIQQRFIEIGRLLMAVGRAKMPGVPSSRHEEATLRAQAVLAEVFEPDRDLLRRDPLDAARLLRALTFAGTHPGLVSGEALSATEIVSVLLDGVRARPEQPC